MAIESFNPAGLPQPEGYRQVTVARGSRTVYLSGQVARTAEGEPVGPGDLAAQTEQAFVNVATALQAAGATLADIAKMTAYVVDWAPEKMADFGTGAGRAGERLGADVLVATTLVGVAALAEPDLLVELDVIAVLD